MSNVDLSKLHVLVVDDEVFVRDLLLRLLRQLGTGRISTAQNGLKALAAVQDAEPNVDVILLDLHMPRMGGIDFIRRMKSDFMVSHAGTPIIVISGNSDKSAMDSVRELGVSLFLLKPVTPEQLETRINATMRNRYT